MRCRRSPSIPRVLLVVGHPIFVLPTQQVRAESLSSRYATSPPIGTRDSGSMVVSVGGVSVRSRSVQEKGGILTGESRGSRTTVPPSGVRTRH